MWDSVCSVRCLCCVNLSYEEVPQSGLLYLHPLICCSVTLTSDAKNNWCVKLNISCFLENYFVCMLHVWERERLPWQCDRWCTLITVVMCLTLWPNYAQNQTQVAIAKDNVWSPEMIWMMWLCCALIFHVSIFYHVFCFQLKCWVCWYKLSGISKYKFQK